MTDLLKARHHYPCLQDAELAERYCDRTSIWYRLKANGYYLTTVGFPMIMVGASTALVETLRFAASEGMAVGSLAGICWVVGVVLLVICMYPGSPVFCVRWLAKATWWNRLGYIIAISGVGFLALGHLVGLVMAMLGAAVFHSEQKAMPSSSGYVLMAAMYLFGTVAFLYIYDAIRSDHTSLTFRVFVAKSLQGWTWRTKWWIAQLTAFLTATACLIYGAVLSRRYGPDITSAAMQIGINSLVIVSVSLYYLVFNPFIRQVEPVLDELSKKLTFKLGYIGAGLVALLLLLAAFNSLFLVLMPFCAVVIGIVSALFTAAYLDVMHDRKYFDIILAQEVAA